MCVDVQTSIEIARPREEVASFAMDPDNATAWYANIRTVRWLTPPPLSLGSEIEFTAHFLGRRLAYTYGVRVFEPGRRFVMSTEQGPFPMETTYEWTDLAADRTRMTLRNRGEPSGFAKVGAPVMSRAMESANNKDLARLKQLLENWPRLS